MELPRNGAPRVINAMSVAFCVSLAACVVGLGCILPNESARNRCGDGHLGQLEIAGTWYQEACDDGNTIRGDGCDDNCLIMESGWLCEEAGKPCTPICGDGQILGDETCDSGLRLPEGYCSDCRTIVEGRCGDGVIVKPFELCDDGNDDRLDGCSATCSVETGYSCFGEPSACTASGAPREARLVDLDATQRLTFCNWLVTAFGGPGRTTACLSNGTTTHTLAVSPTACEAALEHGTIPRCGRNDCTVGEIEHDVAVFNGDLCFYWTSTYWSGSGTCEWVYRAIGYCTARNSAGDFACRDCI